jgi:hypothetical protein
MIAQHCAHRCWSASLGMAVLRMDAHQLLRIISGIFHDVSDSPGHSPSSSTLNMLQFTLNLHPAGAVPFSPLSP